MNIFSSINISICKKRISEELFNNITKHACLTLANIIAIDYEIRLKSTPEIDVHISNCIGKLRVFLGQKVITDDSFSTVLMLFSVAISPDEYQDGDNILNKSEDIIIDTLISTNFGKANSEERKVIKQVLKDLLAARNSYELTNFIQLEPEIFCTTVMHAVKKYQNPKEVSTNARLEINRIVNVAVKHNKKIEIFKQATSKIITAISVLAVGAISVATAGATFAFMVVPASILAIEYAPKIGEKIGGVILSQDKSMSVQEEKITALKTNLWKNNKEFLSQQRVVEHNVSMQKLDSQIKSVVNLKSNKLNIIKDQVSVNLPSKKSLQNNKNSKSSGQIKQR
ncbi:RP853 family protein [Candidatus Tisiphia endosymbiont of Ptychoptera albimana]|uniref:RP853 family protein n=1 Tax=Candidatus Tisiphia endosymbiont of Ptychoptera albimana TaxID=3066260 RepID=UPI00312C8648